MIETIGFPEMNRCKTSWTSDVCLLGWLLDHRMAIMAQHKTHFFANNELSSFHCSLFRMA